MPLCNAKKTIVGRPVTAFLGSFALMGSLVMLTSCADSWPDSLDPSDWYAAGVGEEVAPRSEEPVPGENEDYPNLAEVPETPTNVSSAEEIEQVAQSLSADLANAQYTTDLQRADDETTPQAMPLAQPEVVDVVTETTYIEPGGEIEIAEAQAVVLPEVEEVVEAEAPAAEVAEVVAVEAAPAMETEAVAMAEMAQPEPEPMAAGGIAVGESRVETETIRGEDGELVGTVTRVVVAEQIIVAASETRIEQQTVVDNNSGELIGSVTRTVEVTEVVQTAPASGVSAEAAAAPETEMTFTEVAETLAPSAEPAQVEAVTTVQPVVTAVPEQAQIVTVPAETLDFAALLSASGPDAGTAEQPIVIASAEPAAQTQAVFTTQPSAPVSEVLAAIIRFGDGSSSLGAVERDIVRQLAMLHAERGGQIRLVGHASRAAGGMETAQQQLVNFNISLDRATAVAEELIRQGVPRNDVVVEAAGDNQAGSDAAQDRRVDVLFGA
jgi:outer membrane protein OmpA-like peptidoglycan-associated protein